MLGGNPSINPSAAQLSIACALPHRPDLHLCKRIKMVISSRDTGAGARVEGNSVWSWLNALHNVYNLWSYGVGPPKFGVTQILQHTESLPCHGGRDGKVIAPG